VDDVKMNDVFKSGRCLQGKVDDVCGVKWTMLQ